MVSITKDFLTINPYSRPNKKLNKVKGIVIHWYANPKSKAISNRNFFEGKKNGKGGYASAHYCLDPDNIIQAIPDNEMAYHVGSTTYTASALRNLSSYPNNCTIGIEMYHPDSTGKPDSATYNKAVQLAAKLLKDHGLNETNLWTHHQVVGWKDCHRWYTNNPTEWVKFVADVSQILKGKTTIISTPKKTDTKDLILVPAIGHGDKGAKVRELQTDLVKLGYKVEVDGIFGSETDAAVVKFQKSKGLTADGLVGPNTTSALAKAIASLTAKPVTKPATNKGDMKTNSIVEYLQSIGEKTDFNHRSKLATQYGIKNYTGTAVQNTSLLEKMRNSKPTASTTTKAVKGDQKTASLVDYLKSIGESSTLASRQKLAKKHGITGYEGTAAQNTELLKKLRGQ